MEFRYLFTFYLLVLYDDTGLAQVEKYLNIQDCLEKSMKIKFALKST